MSRRRPTPPVVIMAKLLKHKTIFAPSEQKRIRALEMYWEMHREIPPEAMPVVGKWLRYIRTQSRAAA